MPHGFGLAADFVQKLDKGGLDGRVIDELGKLSYEQLLRISQLLAQRVEDKRYTTRQS